MSAAEWLQCAATIGVFAAQLRIASRLRHVEEDLEQAAEAAGDHSEACDEAARVAASDRALLHERLRAEIRRLRNETKPLEEAPSASEA